MFKNISASVRRLFFTLWALMLVSLPTLQVLAEDGPEAPAEPTGPQGITVMILMLGIAALLIVGFYYIGQNRPTQPENHEE